MQFWNETLELLSKVSSKKMFTFEIQSIRYNVPIGFAIYLCPIISEVLLINPTLKSINLSTNDPKHQFLNILEGKPVDPSFFYSIAKEMNNKKMIEQYFLKLNENYSYNEIDINKHIKDKLKQFNKSRGKHSNLFDDECNYIANHFEQMKEEVFQLDINIIFRILTNSHLRIDSEESIWNMIKEQLMKKHISIHEYHCLLQCIDIHNLSNESFKEFVEMIKDIRQFDKYFWNTIIKYYIEVIQLNEFNKTIENGVFHFLNSLCGGNAYLKGLIDIKTTPTNCSNPEIVIDPSSNGPNSDYWYSRDAPDQWIMFDFKDKKVEVKRYSIQTYDNDSDFGHLKNWVIEGTNDIQEDHWIQIDKQLDNNDLNGPSFKRVYSTSSNQCFRYIRLRGCGCNHRGDDDYDIVLSHFEIFGKITN